jgi:hypothetical protein
MVLYVKLNGFCAISCAYNAQDQRWGFLEALIKNL